MVPAALADSTYTAEGVNLSNITSSDRFYDNGKGYYWSNFSKQVDQLYYQNTCDYTFLGDLMTRVTPGAKNRFDNLDNDSNTCWFNASANVIQYWQSYYGVFYKGSDILPYGYTYSKENHAALGGTQSLRVDMAFYDNWSNNGRQGQSLGGSFDMAANWYFTGKVDRNKTEANKWSQHTGTNNGGYFSNYYSYMNSSYHGSFANTWHDSKDLALELAKGFGYEVANNKIGQQQNKGQILYLGVRNNNTGHALTCYGFTLNNNGELKYITVANSDDKAYGTFNLYVQRASDGSFYLYTNEACTQAWNAASNGKWKLTNFQYINTSPKLADMYNQYTDRDNPLVWNGWKRAWSEGDESEATLDLLPTPANGWQVEVNNEFYSSYYQKERSVLFSNRTAGSTVQLKGSLNAPKVHIDNSSAAYRFTGGNGSRLWTNLLEKTGAGLASFEHEEIYTTNANLGGGELALLDQSRLCITGDLVLGKDSMLTVDADSSLEWHSALTVLVNQNSPIVRDKHVTIKGLDADNKAVITASATTTYSPDNSNVSIRDAAVEIQSKNETSLRNTLENVKLVNMGSGKVVDSGNTRSLHGVEALGGDICFLNKGGTYGLQVGNITIANNREVSVYMDGNADNKYAATLTVTGLLTANNQSSLYANLIMASGSSLDVHGTNGKGLLLGNALTLSSGVGLSSADLANCVGLVQGASYGLFSGATALTLGSNTYQEAFSTWAGDWFTDLDGVADFTNLFLNYSGAANGGQVSLVYKEASTYRGSSYPHILMARGMAAGSLEQAYVTAYAGAQPAMFGATGSVPEPATATLSLLALAALGSRRRRK